MTNEMTQGARLYYYRVFFNPYRNKTKRFFKNRLKIRVIKDDDSCGFYPRLFWNDGKNVVMIASRVGAELCWSEWEEAFDDGERVIKDFLAAV